MFKRIGKRGADRGEVADSPRRGGGGAELAHASFTVLDTELTGLNRKKDEIVAIGAVKIRNFQIEIGRHFHSYIRPRRLDPTTATLVHRITPEQLRQAPPLESVLPGFFSFVGDDIIVGHFIGMDMDFISRAAKSMRLATPANHLVDTMRLAAIYKKLVLGRYHESSSSASGEFNLRRLTKEFDIPSFNAHDALEDALQTAYLFLFLCKKVATRGVVTLADYRRAGQGLHWAAM
ncbi:MAG: 3'-5' exonuclease [Desulfofustis sp. PB-SRB1]|nr:3'-5' exonuclease [Desulfofustis sp. PB-SRB1]